MTAPRSFAAPRRIGVLILALTLVCLGLVAPATSSAHGARADTRGWTQLHVHNAPCVYRDGAPVMCPHPAAPVVDAWRWTGTRWVSTTISESMRVYAYPYAAGYSWIWSRDGGWLAVRTTSLGVS